MRTYLSYWAAMLRHVFRGGGSYFAWLGFLLLWVLAGVGAYVHQLQRGLIVTNMSQQVSWGAYIANFTFMVGVAAAAVLLVVPTYVFKRTELKSVVLIAELLAAAAMVMCLLFVVVDIGRPDRMLHMMPGVGRLNFPRSILAWDVIVLSVYLLLNLHIPGYSLYQIYLGRKPKDAYYKPFVFVSIGWAVSIHTVTAFLYSGLGGRPYWNTAILAPRFLVSAFASGPAILILAFMALNRFRVMKIDERVFELLRNIVIYTLPLNYFLFGCEVFKELYTDSVHAVSLRYLFMGIHGHAMVAPYMWSGMALGLCALVVFLTPKLHRIPSVLAVGSGLCVVGIWIEKGMGLVVPGFIPSPAGDLVEYRPSWVEFVVSMGIWAVGALLFTLFARIAAAIQSGDLRASQA